MCKAALRLALVLALLVVPVGAARADGPGADTTPPNLFLPGDFTEQAWSPDGTWVWWWADAWDDVDGPVGVYCNPGIGSLFPIGQTTVECSASDFSGNTATGSFTVTVVGDETPPTLYLPGPVTVQAWTPAGQHVWFDTDTYAVDDRAGWLPVQCSPLSGSLFPLGTTTVECTATDFFGNTASGSFTVTVLGDDTPPTLHLPEPITVDAMDEHGAWVWYFAYGVDPDSGFWGDADCTPPPYSRFPVGTTTVECTAADAFGNVASGSFTVTVLPPVVASLTITEGTVNPKTGVATIRGTVRCTRDGFAVPEGTTAMLFGEVTQRAGRMLIRGSLSQQVPCSESPAAWSGETTNSTGLFAAGSADVTVRAWPSVPGAAGTATASIKLKAQR